MKSFFKEDMSISEQTIKKLVRKWNENYSKKIIRIQEGYDKSKDLVFEGDIAIEVKEDILHQKTGNFFLEYKCNGRPSGILTTKSKFYFILLHDLKGCNCEISLKIMSTEKLKKMIETSRTVTGGDGNKSVISSRCFVKTYLSIPCELPNDRHQRRKY